MTDINLDSLLKDISPEAPSGKSDRDFESAILALEEQIKGTPEKEFNGEIVQEAKGPKWNDIRENAVALLTRCRHLQVAMYLTRALLHTQGINGLCKGLELLHGYIRDHWESLYPQLEPEDNHDPLQRINILASLNEYQDILAPLMEQPLCHSPKLGKYSYRDFLIANGKITATKHDRSPSPSMAEIEAAFKDSADKALSETQNAIERSRENLSLLRTGLKAKVDSTHADMLPDYKDLHEVLKGMDTLVLKHLKHQKHKGSSKPDHDSALEADMFGKGPSPSNAPISTNEIKDRQDVIRLLDLICTYYEHHEPGSPIPLLLKRARQLVQKNFIEIIQDLAPDTAGKIKNLIIGADDQK